MATFKVLCRVDAYVDYVAENARKAARMAADNLSNRHKWEERGTQEFDARLYITLDANGDEIDGTQAGDC